MIGGQYVVNGDRDDALQVRSYRHDGLQSMKHRRQSTFMCVHVHVHVLSIPQYYGLPPIN